jgi:hypothetical protein
LTDIGILSQGANLTGNVCPDKEKAVSHQFERHFILLSRSIKTNLEVKHLVRLAQRSMKEVL